MEELKNYYVTTVDVKKIEGDMNIAFDSIQKLEDNFKAIFNTIESLEPQQKLFFLDKVVMDMIMSSRMPPFYMKGLLDKMSEHIKTMENPTVKSESYTADYFG